MNSHFEFASPEWFWALLLLPVVAFLLGRSGRCAAIVFSSTAIAKEVSKSTRSRAGAWLLLLRLLTLFAVITALARPRDAAETSEVNYEGIDIMLTLDVSLSMAAEDFELNDQKISRLETAKTAIESFIQNRPNDRIGLIIFSGAPYMVSPLTLNHDWLIKHLEENVSIQSIPESGTAIGDAIAMSVNRLRDLEDAQSRVIILLTDGDNNAGKIQPLSAAEAAAVHSTRIYTIGAGGDKPTTVNIRGMRSLQVEPLKTDTLKEIAETTEGTFFRATNFEEVNTIYESINQLETREVTLKKHMLYTEYFYIPTCLALGLLMLEILLKQTRFRKLP